MSESSVLVEPAYRCTPEFARTLGPEVSDLADLAGYAPDPEQRLALDLIFSMDGAGLSAAFEFAALCPRQNLKTGLFKQAALGWLFLTDQRLIVWSAHEFATAQEAFRDMQVLIEGSDFLRRRVHKVRTANGDEGIELMSGARLIFRARTNSGGRGLSGDKVILDEAFALKPEHMGSLLPTLSARPDPQVCYGSSAPLRTSDVLRRIQTRGRAGGDPRLAYLEWCVRDLKCDLDACRHEPGTPGCGFDDVDNWRAANPLAGRTRANGTGLSIDYIAAERAALPPVEFGRERLGISDDRGGDDLFGPGAWESCDGGFDAEASLADMGVKVEGLGLAQSYDGNFVAVVAAGRVDEGGPVFVKPIGHGPGSAWLAEVAASIQESTGLPLSVDGKGPAAPLLPVLENEGVKLARRSFDDMKDGCAAFAEAVRDVQVRHGAYPELNAAVDSAVRRNVGDRWLLGRKESSSDISVLEAAILAHHAVSRPTPTEVKPQIRWIGG